MRCTRGTARRTTGKHHDDEDPDLARDDGQRRDPAAPADRHRVRSVRHRLLLRRRAADRGGGEAPRAGPGCAADGAGGGGGGGSADSVSGACEGRGLAPPPSPPPWLQRCTWPAQSIALLSPFRNGSAVDTSSGAKKMS